MSNASTTNYSTIFLIEGILLFILGIIGIALPQLYTFSVELLLGAILLVSGIIQLFRCIKAPDAPTFFLTLLSGLVSAVVGALLLTYPVAGVITLTLLLTVFFFWDGFVKLLLAYQLRDTGLLSWLILSGLLALAMGIIIWSGWPGTAAWVIGLLVGINLIFQGFYLIVLSQRINDPALR